MRKFEQASGSVRKSGKSI